MLGRTDCVCKFLVLQDGAGWGRPSEAQFKRVQRAAHPILPRWMHRLHCCPLHCRRRTGFAPLHSHAGACSKTRNCAQSQDSPVACDSCPGLNNCFQHYKPIAHEALSQESSFREGALAGQLARHCVRFGTQGHAADPCSKRPGALRKRAPATFLHCAHTSHLQPRNLSCERRASCRRLTSLQLRRKLTTTF